MFVSSLSSTFGKQTSLALISLSLLLFSFQCSKSNKPPILKHESDVAIERDTSTDSPDDEIQWRHFKRTSLKERYLIKGSESPVVYSGDQARLLLYRRYFVVRSDDLKIEVFARSKTVFGDSIAISSQDSVLFSDYEEGMHFLGLRNNYFLIDHGTSATDHDFEVIDLSTLKSLMRDDYLPPLTFAASESLTYYAVIGPATRENCPDYDEIQANADPYVAEKASFNLHTKVRTLLGDRRCFGLQ